MIKDLVDTFKATAREFYTGNMGPQMIEEGQALSVLGTTWWGVLADAKCVEAGGQVARGTKELANAY